MKQRKQEPDVLHVGLISCDGRRVELDNDGVLTTRVDCEGVENVNILQTRAAFRGFVGSLTELLNYTLEEAEGSWEEDYGQRSGEEGGEE